MALIRTGSWVRPAAAMLLACMAVTAADRKELQIKVLEGEGAFNDIKHSQAHSPVVEIRDEDGRLVPSAKVVFQLPDMGASGSFADGSKMLVANSDSQGRASATGFKPNKVEGRFPIVVTASKEGRTGRTEIMETNTLAGGEAAKSGHGKLLGIVLAVGGAASGGIIAATRGHGGSGGSTGSTAPIPTSVSAGTITVGGPR